MQITITDQQKQQIMQTPDFVAKLSELMNGFTPVIGEVPENMEMCCAFIGELIPFSEIKFRVSDYKRLVSGEWASWDGITWQKFCIIVQSKSADFFDIVLTEYCELMTFTQSILTQIDDELEKNREAAIKSVFLAHKAKNSIIQ